MTKIVVIFVGIMFSGFSDAVNYEYLRRGEVGSDVLLIPQESPPVFNENILYVGLRLFGSTYNLYRVFNQAGIEELWKVSQEAMTVIGFALFETQP